jgi:hypothetical protein
MTEREILITTDPFVGAVNQVISFKKEHKEGKEAEEFLEMMKKRFCIDKREEQIMQEAYETGVLRIWYYPMILESRNYDFPNMLLVQE